MNLEEAIQTAIKYETNVRDLYISAMNELKTEEGKKVFKVMAREEQGHLDYLNSRLEVWRSTGKLDAPILKTVIPSKEQIREGVNNLKGTMSKKTNETEIDLLKKALDAEQTTTNFYKKMVDEISGDGRIMFSRFLEIEEGHLDIVQAEINALSGIGYWYDFSDISLEM